MSSGIMTLGRTNVPVDIGVNGEAGREANTTLAKCVGIDMLRGSPITS